MPNCCNFSDLEETGIFKILHLGESNNKAKLISVLTEIHEANWINSKRLNSNGEELSCNAPNCGGYTLEAELGITPNGFAEPDYLGWEIKQFGVTNFNRILSKVITLMTPEPTSGYYAEAGVIDFLRKYGYDDLNGRPDRINFGGIHKNGSRHHRTNLKLLIDGFDNTSSKIRKSDGQIVLIDTDDNIAAGWSFISMLKHWNRKHNKACYIPSKMRKEPTRQYYYGNNLIMGSGTGFNLFLSELYNGNIYYDPGIKMEHASTARPIVKRRSQFRIKSGNLPNLYHINEIRNLES